MVKLLIKLTGKRTEIFKWILTILALVSLLAAPNRKVQDIFWRYIMFETPAETQLMNDIVTDLPDYATTVDSKEDPMTKFITLEKEKE